MTVYVDDAFIPATVGRHQSRWCHLFSFDADPAELHALAEKIGLKRSYFQDKDQRGDSPWRNHYDVTENKRTAAIKAGARIIPVRDFSERVRAIRAAQRAGASDA